MRLVDALTYGAVSVTVTSLEMAAPPDDVLTPPLGATLRVVTEPRPDLSRDFYARVGAEWHWVDRLEWSDDQWLGWVDRPEHHLLVCELDGIAALAGPFRRLETSKERGSRRRES